MAIRPNGPVLIMTNQNRVVDLRSGHPRSYSGKFSDYVGIDWEVMTGQQFGELIRKQQAASEKAASTGKGDK